MFRKWQDHVYDFEIMIWNHVSDSGKSNAPLVTSNEYSDLHIDKYEYCKTFIYCGDLILSILPVKKKIANI